MLELPRAVTLALRQSKTFTLEMLTDEAANRKFTRASRFGSGEDLPAVLGMRHLRMELEPVVPPRVVAGRSHDPVRGDRFPAETLRQAADRVAVTHPGNEPVRYVLQQVAGAGQPHGGAPVLLALQRGHGVHNLTALIVLDRVWKVVMPADTAPIRRHLLEIREIFS